MGLSFWANDLSGRPRFGHLENRFNSIVIPNELGAINVYDYLHGFTNPSNYAFLELLLTLSQYQD